MLSIILHLARRMYKPQVGSDRVLFQGTFYCVFACVAIRLRLATFEIVHETVPVRWQSPRVDQWIHGKVQQLDGKIIVQKLGKPRRDFAVVKNLTVRVDDGGHDVGNHG